MKAFLAAILITLSFTTSAQSLPPSIPADMGETGGNIVLDPFHHQISIVDQNQRRRIQWRASPSDTYTVTTANLPDGMSINLNSDKRRLYVVGAATQAALAQGVHDTQITISSSTDSRTISFQWHIVDGVQPEPDTSFRACGGNPSEGGSLWSWAWAGKDSQNIQTADNRVTYATDLSGNGHDYYSRPEGGSHATEVGYTWRTYYTPYPAIGLNATQAGRNYNGQDLLQQGNLNADGPFYLAAAVMNTRTGGNGSRELFGTIASGNGLRYSQGADSENKSTNGRVSIYINGVTKRLSEHYSYGSGPLLIEVSRDENDIVRAVVNGVDVTIDGGVFLPGMFAMSGLAGETSSAFDDAGFEYIVCKGPTAQADVADTREYLRSKWNLYPGDYTEPEPEPEPEPTGDQWVAKEEGMTMICHHPNGTPVQIITVPTSTLDMHLQEMGDFVIEYNSDIAACLNVCFIE